MCDRCKDNFASLVAKGAIFGGIEYVLHSKPVRKIADKAEDTVGIPKDKKNKGKMKKIIMESLIYILSSSLYDFYLYEILLKRIQLFNQDYGGFCPCELMKMLYNFLIQIGYDAATDGASIRKALATAVSVFGAESLGNQVNKMMMPQSVQQSIQK